MPEEENDDDDADEEEASEIPEPRKSKKVTQSQTVKGRPLLNPRKRQRRRKQIPKIEEEPHRKRKFLDEFNWLLRK